MSLYEESIISKQEAFEICQQYLEGPWKYISIEDLQFNIFSGGLSNGLYHCALPKHLSNGMSEKNAPKEVLLRIFGPFQDSQEVITREAVIFTILSERNLGPKLFGIFQRGRLEEFIPSTSMDWNDLKALATTIAREMAKIHALQVPISKNPIFQKHAFDWLEFVEKNVNSLPDFAHQLIVTGVYKRELKWLMSVIEEINSPLVFCHNDLQGGNILKIKSSLESKDRDVMLIDFEFAAYNYRGFDIGNHFNERCFNYHLKELPFSFEVDLDRYPSEAEQVEFIDAYLHQLYKEGALVSNAVSTELERKKILKEVTVMRLATHLYWVIWCFKIGPSSTLNSSFCEYGMKRWEIYLQNKEEFTRARSQKN